MMTSTAEIMDLGMNCLLEKPGTVAWPWRYRQIL